MASRNQPCGAPKSAATYVAPSAAFDPDWPTGGPQDLDVSGHGDGYILRFVDRELAIFPSLTGAARAIGWAKEALAMLDATLNSQGA